MDIKKIKETDSFAITELIRAIRPYASDDRLFKAVDAVRVIVHQQEEAIERLLSK